MKYINIEFVVGFNARYFTELPWYLYHTSKLNKEQLYHAMRNIQEGVMDDYNVVWIDRNEKKSFSNIFRIHIYEKTFVHVV